MPTLYGGRAVLTTDPTTLQVTTAQANVLAGQLVGPLGKGSPSGLAEYNAGGQVLQADGNVLDVDHLPQATTVGKALAKAVNPDAALAAIGAAADVDLANKVDSFGGTVASVYYTPTMPTVASLQLAGVPAGTVVFSQGL